MKVNTYLFHFEPKNNEISYDFILGQKNTCCYGNPTLPKFIGEAQNFSGFMKQNIFICILPFKMHTIMFVVVVVFFFQEKIIKKKYVCLPYLNFSDPLPETHYFYLFGFPVMFRILAQNQAMETVHIKTGASTGVN